MYFFVRVSIQNHEILFPHSPNSYNSINFCRYFCRKINFLSIIYIKTNTDLLISPLIYSIHYIIQSISLPHKSLKIVAAHLLQQTVHIQQQNPLGSKGSSQHPPVKAINSPLTITDTHTQAAAAAANISFILFFPFQSA